MYGRARYGRVVFEAIFGARVSKRAAERLFAGHLTARARGLAERLFQRRLRRGNDLDCSLDRWQLRHGEHGDQSPGGFEAEVKRRALLARGASSRCHRADRITDIA